MEPNLHQNPTPGNPLPVIAKAFPKRTSTEERQLAYESIEKHRKTLEKLA